jgi:hypothetical protein
LNYSDVSLVWNSRGCNNIPKFHWLVIVYIADPVATFF